jgi:hypothetical protein
MKHLFAFLLIISLMVLGACSSGMTTSGGARQWSLVKVELDRSNLKYAGSLPLFNSVATDPNSGPPRAFGSLVINDRGRVACQVGFAEPTIALGGQPASIQYEAVKFFGVLNKDGKSVTADDISDRTDIPVGITTYLEVTKLTGDRIVVRTYNNKRQLPYVYTFDVGPDRSVPIFIPFVD